MIVYDVFLGVGSSWTEFCYRVMFYGGEVFFYGRGFFGIVLGRRVVGVRSVFLFLGCVFFFRLGISFGVWSTGIIGRR